MGVTPDQRPPPAPPGNESPGGDGLPKLYELSQPLCLRRDPVRRLEAHQPPTSPTPTPQPTPSTTSTSDQDESHTRPCNHEAVVAPTRPGPHAPAIPNAPVAQDPIMQEIPCPSHLQKAPTLINKDIRSFFCPVAPRQKKERPPQKEPQAPSM